jgi:hypothetical protein
MAPLAAPATTADARALLFREKAFWTFGRGQRLGDLRRLVRQYKLPVDQVYPVGKYFKGGDYGTDVTRLTQRVDVNNPGVATYVIDGLAPATYYFAVTAVDVRGGESARSNAGRKEII